MTLRDLTYRYRKDTRWILAGLGVLLAALTLMYYLTQRSRDLPSELVTNRVLLFVLWYINLTLILVILFVLLRNLFKLVVERHNRILGSKFKTKLVATYIGLSLIPVLLLFFYGSRMLRGWIDRWFDEPAVQEVAAQGHAVAQELLQEIEASRRRDAARILAVVEEFDLGDTRGRPALRGHRQELLEDHELDVRSV